MSCLMNYREEELGELQSPLLESRARLERQQIGGLHDRRATSQQEPLPPSPWARRPPRLAGWPAPQRGGRPRVPVKCKPLRHCP